MKTGHFQIATPATLHWDITYNETLFDRGVIKFGTLLDQESGLVGDEDDGRALDTLVIESAGNWEWALPVLVDSMTLSDEVDIPFTAANVPAYQTASFWFEGAHQWHDIWWGLRGIGFGHFVMGVQGGYVSLSNEFMSKNSIFKVFQHIQFANGAS